MQEGLDTEAQRGADRVDRFAIDLLDDGRLARVVQPQKEDSKFALLD